MQEGFNRLQLQLTNRSVSWRPHLLHNVKELLPTSWHQIPELTPGLQEGLDPEEPLYSQRWTGGGPSVEDKEEVEEDLEQEENLLLGEDDQMKVADGVTNHDWLIP